MSDINSESPVQRKPANLERRDLEDLRKSGLNDESIARSGIYTGTVEDVRRILGRSDVGAGMIIPYRSTKGRRQFYRVKPHEPPITHGKTAKYLCPANSGNRLYIPPSLPADVLQDAHVRLLITEGEKKALKAVQEGFSCVALGGVWNFRQRTPKGHRRVLPDFNDIAWEGREVLIVYDSDAAYNENVAKAELALAAVLTRLDAIPKIARLPEKTPGTKVGLDDFLVQNDDVTLMTVFSAASPPGRKTKVGPGGPALTLADIATEHAELFHDQSDKPYARVEVNGHHEIWGCHSRPFRRWLVRQLYDTEGRIASGQAVSDALSLIEARACFDGARHELHNRVAWCNGELWYDLTDERSRAVRVSDSGWEIIETPPVLFVRYEHQAPQAEPVSKGDVRQLFEFISVKDDDARLLLLVWLIAGLVPDLPHPIQVLHGPQGSGKSSAFRVMRRLIDPSIMETLCLPSDSAELIRTLSHHWCCPFDNVDGLRAWQSDALCRAVTGEAFSKRQLYTDDDDIIYQFQRCIGLNGINVAATRADLLDRCVLIELDRIAPRDRRREEELGSRFEEARPKILGGIFDALVRALAIRPSVDLPHHPRMADFAHWGWAIAAALGETGAAFVKAYERNRQTQNEEVLDSHPVALVLLALVEKMGGWEGSTDQLLGVLNEVAVQRNIDTKSRGWPKQPNVLSRRLKEIRPNLEEAGFVLEWHRSKEERRLRVKRRENIVTIVTPDEPDQSELGHKELESDRIGDDVDGVSTPADRVSSPTKADPSAEDQAGLPLGSPPKGDPRTWNREKGRL